MEFADDIVTLATAAGVGAFGVSLFVGSKAAIPTGEGPYTTITQEGGLAPERTHDRVATPAYIRPGAQLVTRAASYQVAMARARALYNALVGVRNRLVNNVWYREITPLQEPFDSQVLDDQQRVQIVFNVVAARRPS